MGHYEELVDLVESILTDRPTAMSVRQAAYVCAVENAILQSVASGQAVDFAQFLQANNASFLLEGVYA